MDAWTTRSDDRHIESDQRHDDSREEGRKMRLEIQREMESNDARFTKELELTQSELEQQRCEIDSVKNTPKL